MALTVKINTILSDDGLSIYFLDNTGSYDVTLNPTGYGAPNPTVANFTTATLEVTLAGSTTAETPIDIYGVSVFPSVDTTLAYQLDCSVFGLTAWPTGLMRITYLITGMSGAIPPAPLSYRATKLFLIDCEYNCCIKNKKLAIAQSPVACGCDDDRITDLLYAEAILEAAQAATCCGDIASVTANLAILDTICGDCGCGCN